MSKYPKGLDKFVSNYCINRFNSAQVSHCLTAYLYIGNRKTPAAIGNNYRLTYLQWEKDKKADEVKYTVHAEEDAINKFLSNYHHYPMHKIRRMKIKIFIMRIDRNGKYVKAKPCENCSRLLKKYNIRKVEYTND
jgi:deoxycytidylate deaminase